MRERRRFPNQREVAQKEFEKDLAAYGEPVSGGIADECIHCGQTDHADHECPKLKGRAAAAPAKVMANPWEEKNRERRANAIAVYIKDRLGSRGVKAATLELVPAIDGFWMLAAAACRLEWHDSEPTRRRILELLREWETRDTEK